MRPVGCKEWLIDLNIFVVEYPVRVISFFGKLWIMKSFGVCLQIDCLLTERPKHFQSRTSTFFQLELIGSGLGLMIFHKMSPKSHHNYL